ncbi:uncharacterized protein LOC131657970 [Vicia villosa]|uniref:uncharacterized protein LOC131635306 n=1 Tax=Vicia villosa TaxID=3911 RepID=UPI00273AE101|nr:uncharacterized protein LOC131635306 [Vicia villosa]XP_058783294.1 uncharacterized protein LOC131657970 [Vicia villosa]
MEIATHCINNNVDGHIWVEHNVVDTVSKVSVPSGCNPMQENDDSSSSSDDSDIEGNLFDDSEEERAAVENEGYEEEQAAPEVDADYVEVELEKSTEGRRLVGNGKSVAYKRSASKKSKMTEQSPKVKVSVPSKLFGCTSSKIPTNIPRDDVDYCSEELDSSDPDESGDEKNPKYEKFRSELMNKDFKFKLGMEFNSLVEFKDAIREWSVLNGREIRFVKNENYRVRVECKGKCGFLALCSKVGDRHTYQLKTWVGSHSCARVLNNKSANSKWVSKLVVEKRKSMGKVKVSEIMSEMRMKYAVGITKGKAWRAQCLAEEIVEGDATRQYTMLWRYAAELKKQCPGNTIKIDVERPLPTIQPRFDKFYFCLDGCKKGFINGCRPFIGVDGCHLKTKYGGQLLVAVARDPNDQYYPLAFGVVETESKESWRWFLQLLMEDVGVERKYVFISDQQKGLVAVFEEMFEQIEHRICLRHLYANFKKKFGGGAAIRDLLMGAAKATYFQAWEKKMNELKALDKKAWEWLMGVPTRLWCKHSFSFYPKCDVLMNNLSESFNSTILQVRDKPILTMCEWIRNYLMNRIVNNLEKLSKWNHNIMPMPRKRLDKEVSMSGQWLPTWSMGDIWQVHHPFNGKQFIVDLGKKTCSCCFWELVGIPCMHAVSAMSYQSLNPESYVDECYTREAYQKCYEHNVSPINGMDMWPSVDVEDMLPPMFKKGPGRPKKLRFREQDESGSRMRRPGISYRCTKCDQFGHNSRKCKSKEQNPNALKRKRKAPRAKAAPAGNEEDLPAENDEAAPIGNEEAAPTGNEEAAPIGNEEAAPTDTYDDPDIDAAIEAMLQQEELSQVCNPTPSTDVQAATVNLAPASHGQTETTTIAADQPKSTASVAKKKKKKASVHKPKRKRVSERIKILKNSRQISGPGSTSDTPLVLDDADEKWKDIARRMTQ